MANKPLRSFFSLTDETWTEEAHILSRELNAVLQPLIEKWVAKGYRTREIENIITNEVNIIMIGVRIDTRDA